MTAGAVQRRRVRVRVVGTVQGVGFRPYVHRLASELAVDGHVFNDVHGVVIEAEGDADVIERFLERLPAEAPPLASVELVRSTELACTGAPGFGILPSPTGGLPDALVSADSATCEDCLRELFDPADRRHRYAFINCTNCGPRFTIVRGVPYDRPLTTMAGFTMCRACQAEYDDPADRRHHAQPNACPACGPHLQLRGQTPQLHDPLQGAVRALGDGAIVAVKGVGGYHLACLARDEDAVARLRARKHREEKPFALMAPDLAAARTLAELSAADEEQLTSRARPIVLAPRRSGAAVAEAVAPRSAELGVMLPYSPVHHLLLADLAEPIVLTSGNVSDEPIAFRDEDALERLAPIADLVLLHDRPIATRTDDSVVRGRILVRRSRGLVPQSTPLPIATPRQLLACGAELKSTFCLARGTRAWVGPHVGDLGDASTLRSYADGIAHFERLFAVTPEVVVHDLHPEYLSTKYAHDRDDVRLLGVQHHHAHLAACLAEHGETGPAIGAIYDGTGLGTDGNVWGGELLIGDLLRFERAAHLRPVRMPGGEAAIREPWRMACAWLGAPDAPPDMLAHEVDPARWRQVAGLARSGVASPVTTSMGRLFDAVAALCGIRTTVSYEGQAAIELEARCARHETGAYAFSLEDPRPTLEALVDDLLAGVDAGVVASRFHHGVADATAAACAALAQRSGLETVVLCGGVFQNRRLLERAAQRLRDAGLRALVPRLLPPNDGGIAYGQAAIAAARLDAEQEAAR